MPVVVSWVSVVVRAAALEERWPGGAAGFLGAFAPDRACRDAELVAVRLLEPREALEVVRRLVERGIDAHDGDGDAVVVSEEAGPAGWRAWLELAAVGLPDGTRVLAARHAGSEETGVATPQGWRGPAGWIARLRPADRPLRFLRRDPEAAVYVDRLNGEHVVVPLGPPVVVAILGADGRRHEVLADVARTADAIEVGLMHRDRLDDGEGMLFLFPREGRHAFWMKNTRIPLDILFADRHGLVVGAALRARPMSLRRHPCPRAQRVLEVPGGWAEARGIGVGDRIVVAPHGLLHADA